MSRCRACYQAVELHTACSVGRVVLGGRTWERRRYGILGPHRCGGCQTILGGYHHVGCPKEVCPACGGLLVGCKCVKLGMQPRPVTEEEPRELEFGHE